MKINQRNTDCSFFILPVFKYELQITPLHYYIILSRYFYKNYGTFYYLKLSWHFTNSPLLFRNKKNASQRYPHLISRTCEYVTLADMIKGMDLEWKDYCELSRWKPPKSLKAKDLSQLSQWERCDSRRKVREMQPCWLWRWRRAMSEESRQPLAAGKSKEIDRPPEPPERNTALLTP